MDVANNDGQKCLSEEEINGLAEDGELAPDRISHLNSCENCQGVYELITKTDLEAGAKAVLKALRVARYGQPRAPSVIPFLLVMVIIVETFFLVAAIIRVNGLDRWARLEEERANFAEQAFARSAKDCPQSTAHKEIKKE